MVKLVALYTMPESPDEFMRHYTEVHMPLVRAYPGLQKLEVARVTRTLMGEPALFLTAAMYFQSLDALKAAQKSPEGAKVGQDLMAFAANNVSIHIAEIESE